MLDSGIKTVTMPVINFVSYRVIHTAAVSLPIGIGINQNGSSGYFLLFFRCFEKIVNLYRSGREADLAEDCEIIGDAVSLNDVKTELFFGSAWVPPALPDSIFREMRLLLCRDPCGR